VFFSRFKTFTFLLFYLPIASIVNFLHFFISVSTKHVSIHSPESDIAPMSVICGVKSIPSSKMAGGKKSTGTGGGEKMPKYGVKTDKETELTTVRISKFRTWT
jgi:hypothetical protein